MVFNFSQLIKISGTETYPAAQTQSMGLQHLRKSFGVQSRTTLSWHKFLQSHLESFTETLNSQPSTGIRPSTGIIPSGSFTVTPNSAPSTGILPSTGIIPSGSFVWTTRPSAIYRDFYLDQKDYVRLPGFCKNSCQRVPLSATN
jgi:hypothetical protein